MNPASLLSLASPNRSRPELSARFAGRPPIRWRASILSAPSGKLTHPDQKASRRKTRSPVVAATQAGLPPPYETPAAVKPVPLMVAWESRSRRSKSLAEKGQHAIEAFLVG